MVRFDLSAVEKANVRSLVRLALQEDLPRGDITTQLALPGKRLASADVIAREPLCVCGLPIIAEVVSSHGGKVAVKLLAKEGQSVRAGTVLARLSGDARALLEVERTILNFLQRLCGVATFTAAVVTRARPMQVLDTRKTMPGWRALDKYAVRIGGGRNHRKNLSDMILVKNNHIDGGGGITPVLQRIMSRRPRRLLVEVEVRSMDELAVALRFRPDIIMLDNFSLASIRRALPVVRRASPRSLVEVSGGVTLRRLRALQRAGVTLVSMGALTTQARNVDISMRVVVRS